MPDSSLAYLHNALGLAHKLGAPEQIMHCLYELGITHKMQQNYSKASEYIAESLAMAKSQKDSVYLSKCLEQLGVNYSLLKEYDKALPVYKESIELYLQLDKKRELSLCYNNLGVIYRIRANYSEALKYYKKGLEIDIQLDDKKGIAAYYNNIAIVLASQEKYEQAREYFGKSLSLSERMGFYDKIASALINLSFLHVKLHEFDKAIYCTKRILSMNSPDVSLRTKVYAQHILSDAYEKQQKPGKSLMHFKFFHELNDSLNKIENTNKIAELDIKYHTKEQEAENKLLKKDSEIQKLAIAKQKNIRNFLIMLSIIVFLLVIFIYNRLLISRKAKAKLEEQNIIIRQQNEELNCYKNKLEYKIHERTRELELAKEKAEQANHLKTKFLNNLSHEINTPLNAIVGFSDLLKAESTLSEQGFDYIEYIHFGSDNLQKNIDSIVLMSRIQADDIHIDNKDFSVSTCLNQIYTEFELSQDYVGKKNICFVVNDEALIELSIKTDKEGFGIIIYNLLDNALKFTESGSIEFGGSMLDDSTLQFYVKDTGIGIEKEHLPVIFDEFRKIESNESVLYSGLGLGLAIAQQLAHRMNGNIRVESEFGKGSTFYFTMQVQTPYKETNIV